MAKAKKKGIVDKVVDKVVDAVDHVLHPHKDEKKEQVESSVKKSDYASHPKFDKFKSSQGAD